MKVLACAVLVTVGAGLAGAAIAQEAPTPPGAAAPAAGGSPPAAAQPGQPRAFKDVIKDAKEIPGYFTLWQKDEKFWIEIKPEQFDQPFFFASSLNQGIGEAFLYGGLMGNRFYSIGGSYVATFRRLGNQIQLLAKNSQFTAKDGSREARTVAQSFSDSLLASAPVASLAHTERKSVLVEVNALLLADVPMAASALERAFRQPYAFDGRNSAITRARSYEDETTFVVTAHYTMPKPVLPPVSPGPVPFTPPPTTLQDVRSLFLGFHYSLSKLPDEPMRPRIADTRIGYFLQTRWDFSDDLRLSPRQHFINRWRLEKKDPAAALSEPVKPIVFWLDRNIPDRYRPAITEGILEWNKAFERIGFKDAVQVKVQPDDADWDTSEVRRASVRWMTTARPAFGAIGPSQVDPRTGEILDADIGIDVVRLRNARNRRVESIPASPKADMHLAADGSICQHADFAAQELGFALDLLEARGEIAPDGPQAEQFVLEDLKDLMMHEVGHTLGLRHNFRASTVYSAEQLADPDFVKKNGISGSVMEYNGYNIAGAGRPQGAFTMRTLGPYDYWAIEYGYKPVDPKDEADELRRIAGRSHEPLLAYSTDEDSFEAIDPEVNTADLGHDPLSFAELRLQQSKELWTRWQDRKLAEGEDYAILRRNLQRGLNQVGQVSFMAAKFVGGVSVLRDHAGSPRAPLTPVPAERQRAALRLVEKGLFSADSFRFRPEFMRRLAEDRFDRGDPTGVGINGPSGTDYSLSAQVLGIQKTSLNHLMSEAVAVRILESELKLDEPKKAFRLSELYDTLSASIWAEAKAGRESPILRRNLQREHLGRIAGALLRPSATMPADARGLLRDNARSLAAELRAAQAKPGLSRETRAHYAESLNTLEEALKAPLQRAGV